MKVTIEEMRSVLSELQSKDKGDSDCTCEVCEFMQHVASQGIPSRFLGEEKEHTSAVVFLFLLVGIKIGRSQVTEEMTRVK